MVDVSKNCRLTGQLQVLEIFMDVMDLPWRLEAQVALINARNKQALKVEENV